MELGTCNADVNAVPLEKYDNPPSNQKQIGPAHFPDPTPDSPLVDTNRIPSLSGEHADLSVLNAAMKTCGALLGARVGVTKP